jgi:hypothetical protein
MGTSQWKAANNTNPIRCISVVGKWGFCAIADVPGDLKEAAYLISMAAYARRLGENVTQKVVVTQAGAVISPEDVPAKAWDIITCHRRMAFG